MIRKLQKTDLPQVMQIWLNRNVEAHPFVPRDYWVSNFEMVQEQLAGAEVFVYEAEKEVRGFIGLVGAYIAGIFVDKKYRSAGVGGQLLDFAKKQYDSLSLNVYQQNKRAVAFYLREGFSVCEEGIDEETGSAEYTMLWEYDCPDADNGFCRNPSWEFTESSQKN